jgi:hypothetical protein
MNELNGESETLIKLKKPLPMPDGRVIEELNVDISKLNLGDLHNLEMEYTALFPGVGPTNGIYMTDSKYLALIVARINGIVYDNIRGLNAVDAFKVSNRVARFLAESA